MLSLKKWVIVSSLAAVLISAASPIAEAAEARSRKKLRWYSCDNVGGLGEESVIRIREDLKTATYFDNDNLIEARRIRPDGLYESVRGLQIIYRFQGLGPEWGTRPFKRNPFTIRFNAVKREAEITLDEGTPDEGTMIAENPCELE